MQFKLLHDTRHAAADEGVVAEESVTSDTMKQLAGELPATTDRGKDCECGTLPRDIIQQIMGSIGTWPEGPAGKLEGVVRLLGGGTMVRFDE